MILPATETPLIGAHRGASADAPENTIAAFDLAVAVGSELIECDVHATADGVLIIHHDFTLQRTANRSARIADLTFDELQALDVGVWKGGQFSGQRIPTLDHVLDRYAGSVFLNVEIKVDHLQYAGIEDQVAAAIRGRGLNERVVVSSFDIETILRLRRLHPDIRASLLFEPPDPQALPAGLSGDQVLDAVLALARMYGAVGVHLETGLITGRVRDRARTMGLGIMAWTVDDEVEMIRLIDLGIDAIVSNRPTVLRSLVGAHRRGVAGA
jgi:glycerophosphoryl diester phosphodiesterase